MLDKNILDKVLNIYSIDEHNLFYDIENSIEYKERFKEIEKEYGFEYAIKYSEYVYENIELNNYLEVIDFYFFAYADYNAYISINLNYNKRCELFGLFCDEAISKLKCVINKENRLFGYMNYYQNRLLEFSVKYK